MARRFEKAREYTEKYKAVLLPCKHCGCTGVEIVSERTIFPPRDGWSVTCTTPKCDCTGVYTSVRAAVRRWNEKQTKEVV